MQYQFHDVQDGRLGDRPAVVLACPYLFTGIPGGRVGGSSGRRQGSRRSIDRFDQLSPSIDQLSASIGALQFRGSAYGSRQPDRRVDLRGARCESNDLP